MIESRSVTIPGKLPEGLPTFAEALEWLIACEAGRVFGSWLEFCERHALYQVFTREYVEALAAHIRRLQPGRIVEVAAGVGRLTVALRARGLDVVATDPGVWPGVKPAAWVERADVGQALVRHQPDLVIAAWLPVDTPAHRQILADRGIRWYCVIDHEQNGVVGAKTLADTPGWSAIRLADAGRWSLTRWDSLSAITHGYLIQHGVTLLFSRSAPAHGIPTS